MEKIGENPKTAVLLLAKELNEDILQYLPVKSLIRFKSVSKQWRSIIESNYFIKKHCVFSFSKQKFVVLQSMGTSAQNYIYTRTCFLETFSRDHHQDAEIRRLSSYIFPDPIALASVVGSCDGLVCIQSQRPFVKAERSVYIINPSTRKHWQINSGLMMQSQTGFGKDMVTGKYKTIFLSDSKLLNGYALKTMVLTLDNGHGNRGSEKRDIGLFPVSHIEISDQQASVFANGSVFWSTQPSYRSVSKTPIELVALDLHTEKFRRVSWPSWYVQHCRSMRLWSLEDRLCLSNVLQYPNLDVWSLKTSEQWEKIFTINVSNIGRLDTKFWMICLETAYVRPKEEREIDKIPLARWRTTLYRETLVSPYP